MIHLISPVMYILKQSTRTDPANAVGGFPVHETKHRVRLLQHHTSLHRRRVTEEAIRHKEAVNVRCKDLKIRCTATT